MEEILLIENLTKTYPNGKEKLVVVNDICLKGYRGEILGILGPNGSGKTTTVKSIATLIDYDYGRIIVNGWDNKKNPNKVRAIIGAVLEGARNVHWRLTPVENMIYFAGLKGYSKKDIKENIEYFLETLNLKEVRNKQVRQFSKGMQQKVAVACAFITDPQVVLLDEPTLGLDVETSREIQRWLNKFVEERKIFILITSHDMKFIENVCDRVSIFKNGKLLITDKISNLKKYFIKKVYKIVLQQPLEQVQIDLLDKNFIYRYKKEGNDISLYITLDN